jgi:hypothetical protein
MYTDSAHIPLTCSEEKDDPPYSLCLCVSVYGLVPSMVG